MKKSSEQERLIPPQSNKWKKWGPYISERQWGTVREDYSHNGDAWNHITYEMASYYAYRWGEDGMAGFCDDQQILCLAPAFWNGKDPILKERLFGLNNPQGNHGEDVKELYFHLNSSPSHSYCSFLYKYPQGEFPYDTLVQCNKLGRDLPEFEITDTSAFDRDKYFDCHIEYAKAEEEDILMKMTIHNRSSESASIHILSHLWFRNYWRHNPRYRRPSIESIGNGVARAQSVRCGRYFLYYEEGKPLFCENETNKFKLKGTKSDTRYTKDGINNHIIHKTHSVNPKEKGSKMAVHNVKEIEGGKKAIIRIRLTRKVLHDPWLDFETEFRKREKETQDHYNSLYPESQSEETREVLNRATGGLLWTKSFYYLNMYRWLHGDLTEKPPSRDSMRNEGWEHLTNRHVISMPDKWEYPWYAVWDLAFHATSFYSVDPEFAKGQLLLMLQEYYMHPNGQIPAYEWNFSDVNPPVHSWAVWYVYEKDKSITGKGDVQFLERAFHKLSINFTWWVNQKDVNGIHLYDGGFLGLDNIGVFDRNHMPKGIKNMQQADATSWMAMFTLHMIRMSIELATTNRAYEELAARYFRHFLNIAWAMHHIGEKDISLWDDEDNFYYDVVQMENGLNERLRVRSLVGIIPLFAVEVIGKNLFDGLHEFKSRVINIIKTRPDLASLISRVEEVSKGSNYLFSIMRGFRLEHLLKRLLDENEFLSPYGIRSLSKYHLDHPYIFEHNGRHEIRYDPGESTSNMFGGNSNWRGPVWFPINYLIIQSLRKYYTYYGPEYTYEFPTGSGAKMNLSQIADQLTLRLLKLFERDELGKFVYHQNDKNNLFSKNPHFKDLHLFYEYFHGDTGQGLGASHQTGWTALVANLIIELNDKKD